MDACCKEHLLVNGTADNVLRLLPPLNLTREEADAGLAIIERAMRSGGAQRKRHELTLATARFRSRWPTVDDPRAKIR